MKNTQLVRQESHLEPFDPFQASLDCLIVVAFPKSSSKNFPFALSLAESANRYAVFAIGGKPMHVAAFTKSEADAGRAVAVLGYIASWKGTLIFSRGRMLQSSYQVSQVIDCYLNSCACRDQRAYCHSVIDDPFSEHIPDYGMSFSINFSTKPNLKQEIRIDQFSFPCKLLLPNFRFQRQHPSTVEDQIQATGVKQGCNVCPNFEPDAFKKLGYRVIRKDAFE